MEKNNKDVKDEVFVGHIPVRIFKNFITVPTQSCFISQSCFVVFELLKWKMIEAAWFFHSSLYLGYTEKTIGWFEKFDFVFNLRICL